LSVDAANAKSLLHTAAAYIARVHDVDIDTVARALERREEAGSTALGYGLAIPHARIPGIEEPLTIFLRTRYAIEFGAPDGKPTSAFFFIMVPQDGDPTEHLQLLASIASAFGDRDFRGDLGLATTAEQVDDAFRRRFAD
jgi:PTS system nitrogen regulatory IIA component